MDLILLHSNSVKKVDEKPTNLRAMGDDVQHLQLQLPRHDPEQTDPDFDPPTEATVLERPTVGTFGTAVCPFRFDAPR